MARGFNKNNINVSTITSSYGTKNGEVVHNKWINQECGEVIYLTLDNNRKAHYWWLRSAKEILRTKSDIIHLNSLLYSFPFIFLIPFLRRKVIWTVHGELYKHARSSGKKKSKQVLWKFFRLLKHRISFHSTCSYETRSIQEVLGHDARIIEIPLGLDIPMIEIADPEAKYFSFIGRINPIKALDNLLRAFAKSNSFLTSDYKFLIAGTKTGSYATELINLLDELNLSDKVEFVGHVNGRKKHQFLASSTFNFLVSHSENFGVVVLESLAQGTPVAASLGTPWEVLRMRDAGIWTENSVDALKNTIDLIMSLDKRELKTLSDNAIELVQEYSNEKINKRWLDYFDSTKLT